eukprot:TRINITY_DN16058_c0_g1_i1.p1 TRINITY_DN16058_c0_g1~~TRINITY_DN16058_c0_g1_i1.p1  ORF type:complete len:1286 (+),score=472.83 TRINITY_DN16058_c0_g1_i1:108-3965(+)
MCMPDAGEENPETSLDRAPVGKAELLEWASALCGVRCSRFDDLKDGAVFVRIFAKVFPAVNLAALPWCPDPKTPQDAAANWDAIELLVQQLGLPLESVDRKGLMRAKFKPCFQFIVMLFFLNNLSLSHDFAVDFTHPIEEPLAAFLQSTASVEALQRGGALPFQDGDEAPDEPPESHPPPQPAHTAEPQPAAAPEPQSAAAAPPEAGAEVQAVGMTAMPQLNGARGRVIGLKQHGDGQRALVDFGPPHGQMLVRPQNLSTVGAPPPPAGAEVSLASEGGARGRVVGHRHGAPGEPIQVIVELPPPRGIAEVPAAAVSVVAAPVPAVGSEVVARPDAPGGLSGARGEVTAVAGDGAEAQCTVAFAAPRGGSAVLPAATLRVLDRPPPPEGAEVVAADLQDMPGLCGARGVVLGQQSAGDCMRVLVDFGPPHGQMLVRPRNLLPAGTTPAGAAAASTAGAGQAETVDRLLARELDQQQRAELLERELREEQQRAAGLEALLARAGVRVPPGLGQGERRGSAAGGGQPQTQRRRPRVRGELLVTRLRYDRECAERRLALALGEIQALRRSVLQCGEQLGRASERERQGLADSHRAELQLAGARWADEAERISTAMNAELAQLQSRLRYEERTAHQGFSEAAPGDGLGGELQMLRQSAARSAAQLAEQEEEARGLDEAVRRAGEQAEAQRARAEAADGHAAALLQALAAPWSDRGRRGAAPAAQGPLGPVGELLSGGGAELGGADEVRGAVARHIGRGAPCPAELAGGLLGLAEQVRRLEEAAAAAPAVPCAAGATEGGGGEEEGSADALQLAFDRDAERARAADRVAQLAQQCVALRERLRPPPPPPPDPAAAAAGQCAAVRWDQLPAGDPPAAADATEGEEAAGGDGGIGDAACALIHAQLCAGDTAALRRSFWALPARVTALRRRSAVAAEGARLAAEQAADCAARAERGAAECARGLSAMREAHRAALEEQTLALAAGNARNLQQLRVAQEELRRATEQLGDAPLARAAHAAASASADYQRFAAAHQRAKAAASAFACSTLRCDVLNQLRATLEEAAALGDDPAAPQTAELTRTAELLRQQWESLPPAEAVAGLPQAEDEADFAAAAARDELQAQLEAAVEAIRSEHQRAAEAERAARQQESALRSVQLTQEAAQQVLQKLRAETDQFAQEAARARSALGARPAERKERAARLRERCEALGRARDASAALRELRAAAGAPGPDGRRSPSPAVSASACGGSLGGAIAEARRQIAEVLRSVPPSPPRTAARRAQGPRPATRSADPPR